LTDANIHSISTIRKSKYVPHYTYTGRKIDKVNSLKHTAGNYIDDGIGWCR